MPMIIDPIDAIARKKQRTVLYVTFVPLNDKGYFDAEGFDWENCETRKRVINWLESNNISYRFCQLFLEDGVLVCPYLGHIYLDVPFHRENAEYKKLENYFENPDGSMKDETVRFCYLPLKAAMKNAHHDDPDYWDNW